MREKKEKKREKEEKEKKKEKRTEGKEIGLKRRYRGGRDDIKAANVLVFLFLSPSINLARKGIGPSLYSSSTPISGCYLYSFRRLSRAKTPSENIHQTA